MNHIPSKRAVAAAFTVALAAILMLLAYSVGVARQAATAGQAVPGAGAGAPGAGGPGGAGGGGQRGGAPGGGGQRGAGAAGGAGRGGAPGGARAGGAGGGAARGGGGGGGGEIGDGPFDIGEGADKVHVVVVTKGLTKLWGIAFLPNGDMLVTEVAGRLRLIHKDGKLEPEPVAGLPAGLRGGSFGGLMDIALHPKFAENQLVYFAYTKAGEPDATNTALAVFRARWDGSKLVDTKDVFVTEPHAGGRGAPQPTRCCGQGPLDASYGSRITFDKDGFLYVTSGDRNWGEQAQVTSSDLGKVLRLKDDGSIPSDNPFVGKEGYRGEIYTIGHRNPLGLTYDPVTGRMWSTEFGPRGGDELNLIQRGKNYGWMDVTNGTHYNGAENARGKNNVAGLEDPTLWWGPDCKETSLACGGNAGTTSGGSFSPGNVAVYNGNQFPAWKGNLLIGVMGGFSGTGGTGQAVRTFVLRVVVDDKGKFVSQTPIITGLGQRIRDVRVGPEGYVYLLTDTGAILRVEPGK